VNKLNIDPTKLKFGSITNGGVSIATSFKSKSKDDAASKKKEIPLDPFMTPDEQQRQLQYVKANPAEFTDFDIPWSLTVSYSFQFSRIMKPDYSGFKLQTYSSLNFNGDFSLTPKWKIGGTGYVDVAKASIQQLSMFITREMHCWQLAINVTPVGLYRSSASISYEIAHTVSVPADATLDVISKSIYLEEGDELRLTASANSDLEAVCSYE
jgi:hypothetical protein